MISNKTGVVTTDLNDELTRRAVSVVLDKTTDMADDLLRVPLHYYRDPKINEIEETQILRRTPLAIVPSAQLPANNDYVVRSVLGDSLLVTRDKEGRSHVFLNYCRHRGAKPACGGGKRHTIHLPLSRLDLQELWRVIHRPRQIGLHRHGHKKLRIGGITQRRSIRLHLGSAERRCRHRCRDTPRRAGATAGSARLHLVWIPH
jgi:hypothetical protein